MKRHSAKNGMKLLSPIQVGPMEVKNRVVSTAHGAFLEFFRPGADGERYMAYQERRAKGGTGMIITTAMHVHESSGTLNHFNYDAKDMAGKFHAFSSRLHNYGAKAISQLFHFGVQGTTSTREDLHPLWGFSGTTSLEGEPSHSLITADRTPACSK